MLIAVPFVAAEAYANVPDASTCRVINSMNTQLGGPATCSTAPHSGYFVAAGILLALALLFLAPWWLRWIAGK